MMKKIVSICLLIELCLIYSCYCDDYYNKPRSITMVWNHDDSKEKLGDYKATLETQIDKFRRVTQQIFQIDVTITRNTTEDLLTILDRYKNGLQSRTVYIILDGKHFYKHNYNDILERNYIYAGEGFIETASITANDNTTCTRHYKHTCDTNTENKGHKNSDTALHPESIDEKEGNKTNKDITKLKSSNETIHDSQHTKEADNKIMDMECKKNVNIVPQDARCEIIEKQSLVKLVSENIENYPALHEFVYNYDGIKDIDSNKYRKEERYCLYEKTVYVCHDKNTKSRKQCAYMCEDFKIDASTIAMLAPSPYYIKVSDVTPVTAVFFSQLDTSFEGYRGAESLINSFHWMPVEKTMYAIVQFLESINRKRVAIISDDLPSNTEYENRITKLLEQRKFIYASRSCDVPNCDFDKILTPLLEAEAKIIIANIDENNQYFANQVKRWPHLVWFCKSPRMAKRLTEKNLPNIFVTTMMPTSSRGVPRGMDHQTIYTHILDNVISNLHVEKPYNHSDIATQIKHQLHDKQTIKISIKRYGNKEMLASMEILPSNVIRNYFSYDHPEPINNELSGCTIPSSLYFKPCYDMEFIYIMLVIAVFLIAVLVIAYYFHTLEIPYTRMRN